MTRKQRQGGGGNATYDLSSSRNVAAFEALLGEEEDEDPQQLPPRGKRGQQQQKREKEKFFKLKADAEASQSKGSKRQPAGASATQEQQQAQLKQLLDMFQGAAESSIISDVFQGTGSNFQATVDALLSMLGTAPAAAASQSVTGAPSSQAAAAASSASSSHCLQGSQAPLEPLPIAWADLPSDVKVAILSHLPLRDLARAASTCREFCDRAGHMRRHVHHLLLPAGLSYSGLVGMVSGHSAAGVVDLSRMERHISQLDPEELMPQVVAMHKQEAEANIFKAVLAVAAGSTSAVRQQPVSGLVLKGLVGATDRVLAEALQQLKGLRSLDVSHCPNLTNKSLYLLAKYKASEQQQQPNADEESSSDDFDYAQYARANGYSSEGDWEQWPAEDEDGFTSEVGAQQAAEGGDIGGGSSGSYNSAEYAELVAAAEAEAANEQGAAEAERAEQQAGHAAELTVPEQTVGSATADEHDGSSAAATAEQLVVPNPAVRDPVNTALTTAVTNRLAALELRAGQQAAAAAAAVAQAAALGLTELRLSGNRSFADDGLRQVLQGPAIKLSLAVLDVSGCKGLSSAGLVVPPLGVLRELRASRLQSLTQLILQLPASHPLAQVDLAGCHHLRVVDLALANLQQLNLSACRTLYRLRMRCPALTNLSLAQCGMMHEFHTDAWQVPALQQLNLFGCRRASGAMLQPVLETLPELRCICLNGCWSIHSLHLTAQLQLESCDITGCRNLAAFSSSSPSLRELTASACGRLYSLTLASTALQALQLANCSQLSQVHVAAAGAAPAPGKRAAGSSSKGRAVAVEAGPRVALRGLNVNGCLNLSADAKARLAAAVASRQ